MATQKLQPKEQVVQCFGKVYLSLSCMGISKTILFFCFHLVFISVFSFGEEVAGYSTSFF